MGFKNMKKMETTEPSVDEVGKGMKSGGKPKMQMGGMSPLAAAAMPAPRTRRPMPARAAMKRPMSRRDPREAMMEVAAMEAAPMMRRKKGGEVAKVKKELMMHESKPASKAHKGLKTGGMANAQGGYKAGGVAKYATGGLIQKFATGGVVNGAAGYKDGGHCKMKSGGDVGFKAMKKGGCW